MPDLFPTTHATWLDDAIRTAPADARAHVMRRYFDPLCAYARASSLRLLGEPAELVNDFLATRLADGTYLERWSASGITLRRWLANGLLTHARNRAVAEARRARHGGAVDPMVLEQSTVAHETNALLALERAWAVRVATEAHDRVREELAAEGKPAWWDLFRLHAMQGLPYAKACATTGVAPASASHVNRVVAERLRETLAAILLRDGVPAAELDAELASLQELLAS
jgi:hypothetical protein